MNEKITSSIDLDLDKLEALALAATPGPWHNQTISDDECYTVGLSVHAEAAKYPLIDEDHMPGMKDAEFIAAANPATVLQLIQLARRSKPSIQANLLNWALRELLGALPERRDWLNPEAESILRAVLEGTDQLARHSTTANEPPLPTIEVAYGGKDQSGPFTRVIPANSVMRNPDGSYTAFIDQPEQASGSDVTHFDDGSTFQLIGWAGGAAPGRSFSAVMCEYRKPSGKAEIFDYVRETRWIDGTAAAGARTQESGWCVERGAASSPMYLHVQNGLLNWTPDHMKALRFARRADAEQITEIVEDADRIAEHVWMSSEQAATSGGELAPDERVTFDAAAICESVVDDSIGEREKSTARECARRIRAALSQHTATCQPLADLLPAPRKPHSSEARDQAHAAGWNACLEATRAALARQSPSIDQQGVAVASILQARTTWPELAAWEDIDQITYNRLKTNGAYETRVVYTAPAPAAQADQDAKDSAHGHREDYYLLANARRIANYPIRSIRRMQNWALAMELFATGSNSAHQICVDAGIDPDGYTVERAAIQTKGAGKEGGKQ